MSIRAQCIDIYIAQNHRMRQVEANYQPQYVRFFLIASPVQSVQQQKQTICLLQVRNPKPLDSKDGAAYLLQVDQL